MAKLISKATVKTIVRSPAPKSDAVVFIVTALITVNVGLIYAVGIGIAVAAFFALRTLANYAGVYREELPDPKVPRASALPSFTLMERCSSGSSNEFLPVSEK